MRLHRFIGAFAFDVQKIVITDPQLVHQMSHVLRFAPGDELILCDGAQNEARVRVAAMNKKEMACEIIERMKNANEPAREVTLYVSIVKRENFELVAQKATEIGVSRIVPLLCERTVKTNFKHDRVWQIMCEASEQSGRGIVPALEKPKKFKQAIAALQGSGILFDGSGSVWNGYAKELKNVSIFIGPEGGWSPDELIVAHDNRIIVASLGPLTLRAETAAIVATYLAVHS